MKPGINVVEHEAIHGMAIRRTVPRADLPRFFSEAYARISDYIDRKGGKVAGAPFATYYGFGPEMVDVEAGLPAVFDVLENLPAAEGDIHPVDYPGGEAVEYVYFGPYDGVDTAYGEIDRWLKEQGKHAEGPPSEVYVSEPQGDPAHWETHIVQRFDEVTPSGGAG